MKFGLAALLIVLVSATLMQASGIRIYGVAPNLVLIALVVLSFFTDNGVFYALLVCVGAILVRFTPQLLDPLALATASVALAVFWLQRRMVWPGFLGTGILVGFGTIATYALIEPTFLWRYPGFVAAELVYNVIAGLVLYELTELYVKKTRSAI